MSTELKAICLYSVLNTQYSSLLSRWQISAGQLFELMLPVSFALTTLLSTWVLASARKFRFSAAMTTLWTLGTLFFPFITLPLYLIARSSRRQKEKEGGEQKSENDSAPPTNQPSAPSFPLRRLLPLGYLMIMLSLGALYFYTDSRSVDAHLMRANQARVRDQRERVIAEYRAALRLEDDAHTHNLLGRELLGAGRFTEALVELQAAERMGEPDDELPYNIAEALDKLNRRAEAKKEYERFLGGLLCSEAPPDRRCAVARQRVTEMIMDEAR
jgi:tetratricopeptide (TPR) repeat protein